jgi:hypothetical protein
VSQAETIDVQEDISGFLQHPSATPGSLEEAQQCLAEQFGLRVSRHSLAAVYAFMDR